VYQKRSGADLGLPIAVGGVASKKAKLLIGTCRALAATIGAI